MAAGIEGPRGQVNRKQALSLALRIALSALMLAVLVWRVPSFEVSEVVPELTARTVAWLLVAAGLTLAGLVLSALRWQRVLEVLGLEAGLGRLISHYLAGQFVSNVLPTTIGGDVLRVTRLARETGESPRTFASVVLERLTGWLVLPVISVAGFLVNPPLRGLGTASRVALGLAFATLLALSILLYAVADQRTGGRFAAKDGSRRSASAVPPGRDQLPRRPRAASDVLLVGFAYQLVLVLAAVAAAQALGVRPAGLTALLAFFPAVAIAQVLPIGISGLGIREGAFVLFLGPLDVASQDAIALGLLLYLLNLGVSLLGAPAFAMGGRVPAPAEVQRAAP
ncbi:MAG: lysylphosphatidylglycerol synthase transmembrane domain-containing protein [Actinomycetota bacterium]